MDNGSSDIDKAREVFLFQHLIVMFQTLALQQMGKLTSPITGKVERDLHQAKITVDMLGMIQKKTVGNLDENEKKILDAVMMDLQMNYVDETTREEKKEEDGTADEEEEYKIEEDSSAGGEAVEPNGKA